MPKKVAILGGGVAGMSAAHELVERGFEVSVYEYRRIPGGKARSIPVPNSGIDGRKDLPGEHGFRFFPRFYQHVTDTMKRIPYGDGKTSVFNNLVCASKIGIARTDHRLVPFLAHFPESRKDLLVLVNELLNSDMGVSLQEIMHLVNCLIQIMKSSEERRRLDYQRIAWWDFVEADKQSEAFRKLFTGITRLLVAAKAREANTDTIGSVMGQLLLNMAMPESADRVLNGPTNEVWIDPWLHYLRAKGLDYHLNAEVKEILCRDGIIQGATIVMDGETSLITADYYVVALPVEVVADLLSEDILAADPVLSGIKELSNSVSWMNGIQFYLRENKDIVNGHIIFFDSPWALTGISQKQFWPNVDLDKYGDGSVQGILSIDISEWNVPGIIYGKPAMECTADQIKEEVWAQLKQSLNVGGEVILRDEDLVTWFLDEDIHFESPHQTINLEPLLINRVNTWPLRPNAYTAIPNLFLASDYVRTNTDLATMEGANEAARRAVNAIIKASKAKVDLCRIWNMYEPTELAAWRTHDSLLYKQGLPWDGASLEESDLKLWIENIKSSSILEQILQMIHFVKEAAATSHDE